jgi:ligand-binding SRPBCC domain-containing protein
VNRRRPFRFVDELLRGPYRFWRHEHRFEACPNGTRVLDEMHYGVPGGALVHRLFVRRGLEAIFRFRQQQLAAIFPAEPGTPALHGLAPTRAAMV